VVDHAGDATKPKESNVLTPAATPTRPPIPLKQLSEAAQARAVPSSKFGRVWEFGSLGVGLGIGAIAEMGRRAVGGGGTCQLCGPTPTFRSSWFASPRVTPGQLGLTKGPQTRIYPHHSDLS
jgi:hypothetical protein